MCQKELSMFAYKAWIYAVLASLLAGYTGYFIGVYEASDRANIKVENTYVKAELKGKQNYAKVKKEVNSLNDVELIRRYCRSSVHDVPYDKCVRTVTYVE